MLRAAYASLLMYHEERLQAQEMLKVRLHVIEMIDDSEWNEIFNMQGITSSEIEIFKVAIRLFKDELTCDSQVLMTCM